MTCISMWFSVPGAPIQGWACCVGGMVLCVIPKKLHWMGDPTFPCCIMLTVWDPCQIVSSKTIFSLHQFLLGHKSSTSAWMSTHVRKSSSNSFFLGVKCSFFFSSSVSVFVRSLPHRPIGRSQLDAASSLTWACKNVQLAVRPVGHLSSPASGFVKLVKVA